MQDTIRKELPEYKRLAVPHESVVRILDIWDAWHCNGMTPGCDHQRKNWNLDAKIEQTEYQIDWDALRNLERRVLADYKGLIGGEAPKGFTADLARLKAATKWSGAADMLLTVRLLGIDAFSWKVIDPQIYKETTSKIRGWHKSRLASVDTNVGDKCLADYIKTKRETKAVTWVRPIDDPRGLLGKACEVCGYKYGTEHLIHVLPPEIEAEITQLFAIDVPVVTAESEIDDFAKKHGIEFTCRRISKRRDGLGEGMSRHFECTITRQGLSFTLYFSQGDAWITDPTLHDVMEPLSSDFTSVDNARGFEDWASEYGYDSDSRKASKIYEAIRLQADELKNVLGDELYRSVLEQKYAA